MEDESEIIPVRQCSVCKHVKLANSDNFYWRAASGKHKTPGWNSTCKDCWKEINRQNKLRRKLSCLESVI